MKVFVLNTGSSSVKYKLFDMPEERVICFGMVERIGTVESRIKHKSKNYYLDKTISIQNHEDALQLIIDNLVDPQKGSLSTANEISVVGHRVVHGGETFSDTVEINDQVKQKIRELFSLAPLHNPSNLAGIELAQIKFPNAIQIAVFDTAFHQTIPVEAHKYAIPNEMYDKYGIRLYGFHGTSHKYVSELARDYLKLENSKIISIHLGNGCSMTAVNNGKSADHSLGLGPFNGLVMGTRSGDIDHSIIFYMVNKLKYRLEDVQKMLESNSGLIGLTGFSDLRDIVFEAEKGNAACQVSLDIMVYRIKKYIGSYVAAMNGLDCLVFTAGIGENSELVRELVCEEMDTFGIELDKIKNESQTTGVKDISAVNSKIKILVIPTNEELEIARQTYKLMEKSERR